ncbi:hypothetical protein [Kineococcus auxinigenes]|uniref:hypothetical protein n=1 Tax=unclassified Kineococcus TaxID=2621656 RepID=UPI003D7C937A
MPWWAPILSALLAGLLGLGAGLSSVFLTRRFTREQRQQDQLNERRLEQRDVLIELIDAVEHWAPQAEMASLLMGKGTFDDVLEYVDTDSGKALRESVRELQRVLVRCRLIVTDPELRPMVLQMVAHQLRQADEINGPLLEAAKRGDAMEEILASIRFYRDVKLLAVKIQESALRRLATPHS